MNKARQKKLIYLCVGLMLLTIACFLVIYALRQNINLFYTPAELYAAETLPNADIKVGGMIEKGTVVYANTGLTVHFTITDFERQVDVSYSGVLPDLFKEGKGVVVQGRFQDGVVKATQVLAKHDENYMPPQINMKGKRYDS